jgi:hypothetical protein
MGPRELALNAPAAQFSVTLRRLRGPKKLRPALGGELAARDPVWDGEGWGCDRVACLLDSLF